MMRRLGFALAVCAILYVVFRTPIAFTWYVLIGTTVTFSVGLAASLFERRPPEELVMVRQPVGGAPHLPSRRATAEE